MTAITTRHARLHDLEAVARLFDLYRQFYEMPADAGRARAYVEARMRRSESVILVAEDDGERILGFCQLYPSFCSLLAEPILVLNDLFVHPSGRRTGAGKALMLAAELYAQDSGAARMDLQTAESNRAAQALYESLGWTRDTVFRVYSKPLGRRSPDAIRP